MAKHVFGTESFQIAYPIYNHQLRFITPVNDTIPFRISGDSLEVSSSINGDYRITSFTRQSGSADKAKLLSRMTGREKAGLLFDSSGLELCVCGIMNSHEERSVTRSNLLTWPFSVYGYR